MKEKEPISVNTINLLGDSILKSLVSDFSWEQPPPVISWPKFANLNLIVNLPYGSYGLSLINIPVEVRSFLEELIRARMNDNPKQ